MDKPTSIPQECVPESVIERAAAAFARHDHEQVEWERIPEEDRDYYRRVALDMLTAAQQQGGGGCSHEAWEENGGWRTCVDCGHGWSARTAPPSAPVGVEGLVRLLERIRDLLASLPVDCLGSGTSVNGQPYPIRDEVIHGITKALAQQPAAVDEATIPAWRVMPFTGSWKACDERWEVYSPDGSGGVVLASEVRSRYVADLLDALATQPGGDPRPFGALTDLYSERERAAQQQEPKP